MASIIRASDLQPGRRPVAGIDHQRGQAVGADHPRHRFGIRLGLRPARIAVAPDVGSPVGQQRDRRRHAARAGLDGQFHRGGKARGHRRGPAARKCGQAAAWSAPATGWAAAAVRPWCRETRPARHGRAGHRPAPAGFPRRPSPRPDAASAEEPEASTVKISTRSDFSCDCFRRISSGRSSSSLSRPRGRPAHRLPGGRGAQGGHEVDPRRPSSRPGREGSGRPRRLPRLTDPVPVAPLAMRAARPAASRASRSAGRAPRIASSRISSGSASSCSSSGFCSGVSVSGSGGGGRRWFVVVLREADGRAVGQGQFDGQPQIVFGHGLVAGKPRARRGRQRRRSAGRAGCRCQRRQPCGSAPRAHSAGSIGQTGSAAAGNGARWRRVGPGDAIQIGKERQPVGQRRGKVLRSPLRPRPARSGHAGLRPAPAPAVPPARAGSVRPWSAPGSPDGPEALRASSCARSPAWPHRSSPPSSASRSMAGCRRITRQRQAGEQLQQPVAHRTGPGAQPQARPDRQDQRPAGAATPRRGRRGEADRSGENLRHDALDPRARPRLVQRITAQAVATATSAPPGADGRAPISAAPSSAASARAARSSVNSPRRPSDPSAMQSAAQSCSVASGVATLAGCRGRPGSAVRRSRVLVAPARHEGVEIGVIGIAAADHLDPGFHVARAAHLDRQAEPVQQLRPQFAFFGVAGADQHEARRMADRQPLAFHHVLARLRHVQQQVDDVILQQVDLVDIEIAAVRPRQQARAETPFRRGSARVRYQARPPRGPRSRPAAGRSPGSGAGPVVVAQSGPVRAHPRPGPS